MAAGSAMHLSHGPVTSRFIDNFRTSGNQAVGCAAGATSAGTGSAVTMAWTLTSDAWAVIIVEVLGTAFSVSAEVAAAAAAAPAPATVPFTPTAGPNYAALAADLRGGTGQWRNPFLAEGGP
jgi:hypothetical protein